MKLAFAIANTTVVRPSGASVPIIAGQHWPADDPLVVDHPSLFSDDPTTGIRATVPLAEADEESDEEGEAVRQEWEAAAKLMAETGHTPESALAAVQAATPAQTTSEEDADAGQQKAPVEQATKAPGEKRPTRRRG